jgi:hypothetical protein
VYVTQQLTLARGALEPIFKVPAGTGSGWNGKKVPAGTGTDSLSDRWSYVTLSAARHFQSSRREHANVRIKRLT